MHHKCCISWVSKATFRYQEVSLERLRLVACKRELMQLLCCMQQFFSRARNLRSRPFRYNHLYILAKFKSNTSRSAGHGICSKMKRPRAHWRVLGLHSWKEKKMPLINLIIVLVVVGVILWLINNYIPMDWKIKRILNVVVVIGVILWLLSAFGIIGSLSTIRIGS